MNKILKLEEAGQFILAWVLYYQMDYAGWVFWACILLPDLSMLGYLVNTRVGAWSYNLFHHKLLAVLVWVAGFVMKQPVLELAGIILFAHASMDRIFGYGLKFKDDFKHTHLG